MEEMIALVDGVRPTERADDVGIGAARRARLTGGIGGEHGDELLGSCQGSVTGLSGGSGSRWTTPCAAGTGPSPEI